MGNVIVSLCLSVHTRRGGGSGTYPGRGGGIPTLASSRQGGGGGCPSQVQMGGYPSQAWGTPIQVQIGGTPARSRQGVPWPGPDGGVSHPWMGGVDRSRPGGIPPPPVRTTEAVLGTRRAVCLLRSRRRTFLF